MQSQLTEWSAAEAKGWERFDRGDVTGALSDWYDAAVLLDESPETARSAGVSLQHIALAYSRLGKPNEAIRYLERALERHYAAPPPTGVDDIRFRADCFCRMGDSHAELLQFPKASERFSRASQLAEQCGDTHLAVECLVSWALAAESDGDILWAVNVLNRARNLARTLPEENPLRTRTEQEMRNILLAATEI